MAMIATTSTTMRRTSVALSLTVASLGSRGHERAAAQIGHQRLEGERDVSEGPDRREVTP